MTPDETSAAGAQDEQAEKPVFDPDQLALIPEIDRRWSWVEIDLSAIRHNVGVARSLIKPSTRLLAVVKSDAYGHGAVRVAKTALQLGRRTTWAVATVDEGIKLREGMVGRANSASVRASCDGGAPAARLQDHAVDLHVRVRHCLRREGRRVHGICARRSTWR